ncbi:hypothetical protein [Paraburkholderia xenovorans]
METVEAEYKTGDFSTREDVLATQNAKLAELGRRLSTSPVWRDHFKRAGL